MAESFELSMDSQTEPSLVPQPNQTKLNDYPSSIEEMAKLTHVTFNKGAESTLITAARPCESEFLESLIKDFTILIYLARLEFSKTRNLHATLSNNGTFIAKQLNEVMHQCQRLEATPELFPTSAMKEAFLLRIAQLSSLLTTIEEIVKQKHEFEFKASAPIGSMERPFTNEVLVKNGRLPISTEVPHFLPDKVDAQLPWNNWLGNSAKPVHGWIGLEQKIPRVGDRLNRLKTNMYETVRKIFEEDELVHRDLEKDPLEIAAPGDKFRHMTWSGFSTVPLHDLHFRSGHRKSYDSEGVVTLEYISKKLGSLHESINGYPRELQFDSKNCAYFRYAMAYASCPETG